MDKLREAEVFHEAERLDVFRLFNNADNKWRDDYAEDDDTNYELPFLQLFEGEAKMWMGDAGDCDNNCDED